MIFTVNTLQMKKVPISRKLLFLTWRQNSYVSVSHLLQKRRGGMEGTGKIDLKHSRKHSFFRAFLNQNCLLSRSAGKKTLQNGLAERAENVCRWRIPAAQSIKTVPLLFIFRYNNHQIPRMSVVQHWVTKSLHLGTMHNLNFRVPERVSHYGRPKAARTLAHIEHVRVSVRCLVNRRFQ